MFVSDLWSLARIPERYPRKGDRVTATAVTPEKTEKHTCFSVFFFFQKSPPQ